jgi:hypothetical protein
LRREVFSLSLGVVAAVALVSAITSLRTAAPPEAATEILISGDSVIKTAQAAESLRDSSACLPFLLSLLSATLLYKTSRRLLER